MDMMLSKRFSNELVLGIIIGLILSSVVTYVLVSLSIDNARAHYTALLNEKDNHINHLEGRVTDFQNYINYLNSQIFELQSDIEEMEKLIPPLLMGEWNTIITISSSGSKTTDVFNIPSDNWRINWAFTAEGSESAVIYIDVYEYQEKSHIASASASGGGSQTTYIYDGPGNFYIEVNSGEAWTLIIQAFIPD